MIEDAPCLSMNDFDSTVLDKFGTYFFLKRLVGVISVKFFHEKVSSKNYLRNFFATRASQTFFQEQWIDSIEIKNFFITPRKVEAAWHTILGERIITANKAQVQN